MYIARMLLSNVPTDCRAEYLCDWLEGRGYRVSRLNLASDRFAGGSSVVVCVQLMNSAKLDEAVRTLNGQVLAGRKVQVRHAAEVLDNVLQFPRSVA